MARPGKDSHPISIRMDTDIYNRLDRFCKESGQMKTAAIEKAVKEYLDRYEKQQEMLKRFSGSV